MWSSRIQEKYQKRTFENLSDSAPKVGFRDFPVNWKQTLFGVSLVTASNPKTEPKIREVGDRTSTFTRLKLYTNPCSRNGRQVANRLKQGSKTSQKLTEQTHTAVYSAL